MGTMRITALPFNVLSLIAAQATDPVDLLALSHTCRTLRDVIGVSIYGFVSVRKARDDVQLARLLADHPLLARYIKHLHVDQCYDFGYEPKKQHGETRPFYLHRLDYLQGLYVSTGKEAVFLASFLEGAAMSNQLSQLKTCTLSFSNHNFDFFPAEFEPYWKVFLLPNLETLTIFSATMDSWDDRSGLDNKRHASNLQAIAAHQGSTSLRRLCLWNCEIDIITLGYLLRLPRHLHELVLHCTAPSSDTVRTPLTEDSMLAALKPVTCSLRSLTFIQDAVERVAWCRFPALRYLRVHPHPFFGVLEENTHESLRQAMPPALTELVLPCCRFSGTHWMIEDAWTFFAEWLANPTNRGALKTIRLHMHDRQWMPRRIFEAFGRAGVELVMEREYSQARFEWQRDAWPVKPTMSWPLVR